MDPAGGRLRPPHSWDRLRRWQVTYFHPEPHISLLRPLLKAEAAAALVWWNWRVGGKFRRYMID